jgi:hypothetical protein
MRSIFAIAVCLVALSARTAVGASGQSDVEVWNEGVEYYRSGDVTNALRALRPLTLTREYGVRASEVVAKLEYERGNIEEAADAAQIALRANPADAKANRNFTRAVEGLPELLEAKRIDEILKSMQGRDPGSMMLGMTRESRRILDDVGGYTTNGAAKVVSLSDKLSDRMLAIADMWIAVKEAICQAVTNEEQAATILLQVDQAREKTRIAAGRIADIDAEAYSAVSDVEHDCTRFLKMTILPPDAMDEGLVAQSNAWQDVESFNGRDWQQDALDYTRSFRARFPAWALAYEQQAQSDTNRPPFTVEDQAKISALATELEKVQMECVNQPLPPSQERALDLIREIAELLPKGGGQSGQQGQSDQRQQGDRDRQQDGQEQQQAAQDNGESQEGQDVQEAQETAAEEEDGGDEADGQSSDEKEIDAILRKVQERSDEHEADKKARIRKAPLPPNERDW